MQRDNPIVSGLFVVGTFLFLWLFNVYMERFLIVLDQWFDKARSFMSEPTLDPRTESLLSKRAQRLQFWYPNRRQWWVIGLAYTAALLMSADAIDRQQSDRDGPPTILLTFIAIAAALLVWRLSKNKRDRGW